MITRYQYISTHSLTKRLTGIEMSFLPITLISTHSLTKRLTIVVEEIEFGESISTHSLTKRLTGARLKY